MARLLFSTHDPGGANMLLPVMGLARSRGHQVAVAATGPAAAIWRAAGEAIAAGPSVPVGPQPAVPFAGLRPDLLVTGTGMTDSDRKLWSAARTIGLRSLAFIDAWTSLAHRFRDKTGQPARPDAVAVINEKMRDELAADGFPITRMHVVGQPHLQALARRLAGRRDSHGLHEPPLLAFFSEPLAEDWKADPYGFDEITVVPRLLAALAARGPLRLVLKAHPREPADKWPAFLAARAVPPNVRVAIVEDSVEKLLTEVDGVLGMTSMALIEAALVGVPALSLQPGRGRMASPLLDDLPRKPVVETTQIDKAVAQFIADIRKGETETAPTLVPLLADADQRSLEAIEAEAGIGSAVRFS
jgi:hypothetical protein